jgi:hypothetical protein
MSALADVRGEPAAEAVSGIADIGGIAKAKP